jgi:hypothetical protein
MRKGPLRQNDDTSDGHNTDNLTVFLPRAGWSSQNRQLATKLSDVSYVCSVYAENDPYLGRGS